MTTATPDSVPHPRVLLCEDDGLTIMMLHRTLRANGYVVAGEAATALEAIRIAANTPLDLILMDVNLQGPMDGIEAVRQILANRFVPVIMLTALVDKAQVHHAFEAGACGYISKPITSHNLIPMLTAILSQTPVAQTIEEARRRFDAVSGTDRFHSAPASPVSPASPLH